MMQDLIGQVVIELPKHLLETRLLLCRDGCLVAEYRLVDGVLQIPPAVRFCSRTTVAYRQIQERFND